MTELSLVPLDGSRVAISGVQLPSPPPTRVYISGRLYRIAPTSVPLPPIANVVKFILNWVGPAGRVAKNILHNKYSAPSGGSTSDATFLLGEANAFMTNWATANVANSVCTSWTLQSVTAKDAGGTTAQATSTHAAIPGLASDTPLPPGIAVVISWQIAESYRGGKPRTYIPGVPTSHVTPSGGSGLDAGYCSGVDTEATAFLTNNNTTVPTGFGNRALGTVSYYTGHAIRPTPLYRTFIDVHVHERIDSQRRRNGRESTFPTTP